ncbi:MAG: hypothetical protein ACYDHP_05500 [Ferrimicrobium sp.]
MSASPLITQAIGLTHTTVSAKTFASTLAALSSGGQAETVLYYPGAASAVIALTSTAPVAIPAANSTAPMNFHFVPVTASSINLDFSLAMNAPDSPAQAAAAAQALGLHGTQAITSTGNPALSSTAPQPVTTNGSTGYTWTNPQVGQSVTLKLTSNLPYHSTTWSTALTGSALATTHSATLIATPPWSCTFLSETTGQPSHVGTQTLEVPKTVQVGPTKGTVIAVKSSLPATWSASAGKVVGHELLIPNRPGTIVLRTTTWNQITCATAIHVVYKKATFPWWIVVLMIGSAAAAIVLLLARRLRRKHRKQESDFNSQNLPI